MLEHWPFAPAETPLLAGTVHLWLLDLDAPLDNHEAWASLSEGERRRGACLHGVRQARYRSAQYQLRCILAGYLGTSPAQLRFARAEGGKPYLVAPQPSALRFNLSHSRDRALVGIAPGRELGVDIECHRPVNAAGLARRFFSRHEAEILCSLPEPQRSQHFFRLWTAKEALGKALGIGLRGVLDGARLDADAHAWESAMPGVCARDWRLCPLPPLAGFSTALAVAAGEVEVRCWSRRVHPI